METELWEMAASTRGDSAAAAAFDALLAFAACTKYPYQSGASSSQVARECSRRLRLWSAGELDALLREAVAASAPRTRVPRSSAVWMHGRAAELVRVQRYKAAAALTESYGVAPCTDETVTSLRGLFPPPPEIPAPGLAVPGPATDDPPQDLGPPVSVESLRYVLSKAPKRSAPHRDGWRVEHLRAGVSDDRCATAMAGVFTRISRADVPPSVKDYFGSATLIALMKKDASDVRALREAQGADFRLPVRPIAFGTVLVRVAALCSLYAVRDVIPASVGPHQFAVGTRHGTDMIQWLVQACLEIRTPQRLAVFNLDARNGFNTLSRDAMRNSLLSTPALHPLLPLYDMLYGGPTPCWLYDYESSGAPYATIQCQCGVRQGDPLGMLLYSITVAPLYSRLAETLGAEGLLVAYADDVFAAGPPGDCARALSSVELLFATVGLQIGWGPGKTEVCLPPGADTAASALPTGADGSLLPVVTEGFSRCLGIPRHPEQDSEFLQSALSGPAARLGRLLGLVTGMSPEHPAEALRLLQLCAVSRFAHFMRGLPPNAAADFFRAQDSRILAAFQSVSSCAAELGAFCTARLPVSLGGAAVTSLSRHCVAHYVGGFFDFAGPLTARLREMPRVNGVLCDALSHYLSDPAGAVAATFPWARSLSASVAVVRSLWSSFRPWEVAMATDILPAGPAFLRAGDLLSSPSATPPRIDLHPLPDLRDAAVNARGVHHVSRRISHMLSWREFFDIYVQAPVPERIRLLSQSGPGSVSFLSPDTSLAHSAHPEVFCASLRRAVGLSAVGPVPPSLTACPTCNLAATDPLQLERHIPRCPIGDAKHRQHAGLAQILVSILKDCGAKKDDILWELRGLRPRDHSRPCDVGWADFYGPGRHLLCDGSVVSGFVNTSAEAGSTKPGLAARDKENQKLNADACSSAPVAVRHRLVPCVVEEGGRIGGHFQALLKELAETGVSRGVLSSPASWSPVPPPVLVSRWVGTWRARISSWLHFTLSRKLLRTCYPDHLY